MAILHTAEVTGSSPVTPTVKGLVRRLRRRASRRHRITMGAYRARREAQEGRRMAKIVSLEQRKTEELAAVLERRMAPLAPASMPEQ